MVCNVMMKIYINNDDIEHEISKIYENKAKWRKSGLWKSWWR